MTPRWDADLTLTTDDARAVIDAQFPDLAPAALERVGEGWDNIVFRVNDRFVFRFPRREIAVALVEAERVALPVVAPRVPLAVPEVVFAGAPSDRFPRPFLGYRWIGGVTADRRALGDEARERLARTMGIFLRALHAIPTASLSGGIAPEETSRATATLPGDTMRRLDVEHRRGPCLERLDRLARKGVLARVDALKDLVREMPARYHAETATLVHGDLDLRHVLVDDADAPAGVIDWGDVHLGDAATDLAIAYTLVPARRRQAFWEAYGPVPETRRRVARFRGLYAAVNLLEYAVETAHTDLVRETSGWLENVAGPR